jgi:hypothetical protein
LLSFGIRDKTLPQATRLDVKPAEVKRGKHPLIGAFMEEAESVYSAGADLTFYARQRVYSVGQYRYVATAITNYAMVARVQHLFEEFFVRGFDIDLPAATAPDPLTDAQLRAQGDALLAEARQTRQEAGETVSNATYRAFLRYLAALNLYERATAPAPEYQKALAEMSALRLKLQEALKTKRHEIRPSFFQKRWSDLDAGLAEIESWLDSSGDSHAPAQREEWLIWTEEVRQQMKP